MGRTLTEFHRFLGFALIATSLGLGGPRASAEPGCGPTLLLPEPAPRSEATPGRPWDMTLDWDGSTLLGWKGTAHCVPNAGTSNRGIFLLTQEDGSRSLLRVSSESAALPGGPSSRFHRQWEGMKLQERFGGPRILKAGVLTQSGRHPRFFVLMECLFCGERSENLKDVPGDGESIISEREASGQPLLGELGEQLAGVIEHRVLPVDPDVLVSADGGVRWLDGERWERVTDLRKKAYEFASVFWTVFEHARRSMNSKPLLWPAAGDRFLDRFFTRLDQSVRLSREEKEVLFFQIFEGQAVLDYRRFEDFRTISEREVELLLERALRFRPQRLPKRDPPK